MGAPDLALSSAIEAVQGAEPIGGAGFGDMGSRSSRPAWHDNPVYNRVMQLYLAWADSVDSMVESADLEWRDSERARFFMNILTSAVAPSNSLLGNPAAIKRAYETSGASVARGLRNMVRDIRRNGGMPSQVDARAFTLGGPSTFVLSNAGHIASLVNPPGNPKAHYFTGPEPKADPDVWRAAAERQSGTWWEHRGDWVGDRSGTERKAPARLGSRRHKVVEPAPGSYVRGIEPLAT